MGCLIALVLAASTAPATSAPLTCGPRTTVVKDLQDRGIDHARHGRFAEAEPCFLLAREQASGVQQWTNLGSLYTDWGKALLAAGKDAEAKPRIEQSAAAFEAAFKAPGGPPPAQAHYLLAGDYYTLGQRDKAIAQLEKLLLRSDAQPADRERAHHMLDSFVRDPPVALSEKAWAEHDAAFKEGSGLVSPHLITAGRVLKPATAADRADLKKGIDRLKRVVALNPRNWSAYWFMGKAQEALGEARAAYEALKRSGAIHPYHPDVAREECVALLNLGRASEGLSVARRAVKYNPEDPGLRANLALAELLDGDVAAAESDAVKAQAAAPDDAVTRSLLKVINEVKAGKRQRPKKLPIPSLE
jgi:tetratricopeptide (TPR) repeat protein